MCLVWQVGPFEHYELFSIKNYFDVSQGVCYSGVSVYCLWTTGSAKHPNGLLDMLPQWFFAILYSEKFLNLGLVEIQGTLEKPPNESSTPCPAFYP